MSKSQIKEIEADDIQKRAERDRLVFLEDVKDVIQTPHGKRVIWAWLDRLGYFGPIWRRGADIHMTSARHDAAREIFIDCTDASPEQAFALFVEGMVRGDRGE